MKDKFGDGEHETRLQFRRCRCGTLASTPSESCAWHAVGSARYASDLLTYLIAHRAERRSWRRLLNLFRPHKDYDVNKYMFEFRDNDQTERAEVHATNSLDAFDAFRADHPHTPITNVWVDRFATQ